MTVSTRTLSQISEEMASLDDGDKEVAHSRADDLLIETIMWLVAGENREVEDKIKNIVGNWRQLDKWYA